MIKSSAVFLILTQITIPVFADFNPANSLNVASESSESWAGLIPNFMLDTTGFEIESGVKFAVPGLDHAIGSLPLIPLYKTGFFGRTFVGVKIPVPFEESDTRKRIGVSISYTSNNSQMNAIANELRKIKFDDNTSLNAIFYKGELYGIRSDYALQTMNSTSVGFHINFQSEKTIDLGDKFEIGGTLNLGSKTFVVGKESGINLFAHLNRLTGLKDEIFNFEDSTQFNNKVLKFAPFIHYQLGENAKPLEFGTSPIKAEYILNMPKPQPKAVVLKSPIPRADLSNELQTELGTLQEPSILQREVDWQTEVQKSLPYQAVWSNKEGADFLQTLCDHISAGYQMPEALRPRCRIAASFAPNAWAYPGGDIFISAGLLGILEDLDGLVLVLGHEIGHVIGRHTTRAMPGRLAFAYAANGAALAAQIGLTPYAMAGGRGILGETNWLTWFPQSMILATGLGLATNAGLELLFFAPYAALMAHSRSNEWQADRFGQEIAIATGSQADKLHQGWSQFQAFIEKYFSPEKSWTQKLKQSHPSAEDRRLELVKRQHEILNRLKIHSDLNRMPQDFYDSYNSLHKLFRPKVEAWGHNIKNKRERGDSRASQFAINTWLSPSGQCILHALQGASTLQLLEPPKNTNSDSD